MAIKPLLLSSGYESIFCLRVFVTQGKEWEEMKILVRTEAFDMLKKMELNASAKHFPHHPIPSTRKTSSQRRASLVYTQGEESSGLRSAFESRLKIGANVVVEILVQKAEQCWELPGRRRTGRTGAGSWGRSEVGGISPEAMQVFW